MKMYKYIEVRFCFVESLADFGDQADDWGLQSVIFA